MVFLLKAFNSYLCVIAIVCSFDGPRVHSQSYVGMQLWVVLATSKQVIAATREGTTQASQPLRERKQVRTLPSQGAVKTIFSDCRSICLSFLSQVNNCSKFLLFIALQRGEGYICLSKGGGGGWKK